MHKPERILTGLHWVPNHQGWKSLLETGGGALGIQFAKTLIIGAANLGDSLEFWRTLFSPYKMSSFSETELGLNSAEKASEHTCFGSIGGGPAYCVVQSTSHTAVQTLVLSVRSIKEAKAYAKLRGWPDAGDNHTLTIPQELTRGLVELRLVQCSTLVPDGQYRKKGVWCREGV